MYMDGLRETFRKYYIFSYKMLATLDEIILYISLVRQAVHILLLYIYIKMVQHFNYDYLFIHVIKNV